VIGRHISHFYVIRSLGAGGMGVVYEAQDTRLPRSVAIKVLKDELTTDVDAIRRFKREARLTSSLNHPNICTVLDASESESRAFIAMELLEGVSLKARLMRGPPTLTEIIDIIRQVVDALGAAHDAGIIHRDIKPGNIFITDRGHVKVLDFGLAKLTSRREQERATDETYQLTEAGVTLGTIAYMSPEQATGEDLDPRTDLFSLGVVLYECATGHHPFPGSTSAVTLSGILTKAPVAPITLNREIPLRLQEPSSGESPPPSATSPPWPLTWVPFRSASPPHKRVPSPPCRPSMCPPTI
jgi:serine/threonine protein kinase